MSGSPWWLELLHDQASDVRYAVRALAKNPVFSLTVVGVLTLGIGLNAAVFTMLKGPSRSRRSPYDTNRSPRARGGRGKSPRSLALIEAARTILEEIQPASVRAVCYRLFTMTLIPSMAKTSTSRVSKQITWAREHGLIPWDWIVDETREAERVNAWENPAAYVEDVKRG